MHPGVPLATEHRNGREQALHTGHAVLLSADGTVERSWGDPETATYWRSAPKPLQALPFIEAMDELGYDDADLALACASHSSEPRHTERAEAMLRRAGLRPDHLRCGAHAPLGDVPVPAGGWTDLHNNCSGKHAAMLAVSQHHGWDLESYQHPDHPLQRAILAVVEEASGLGAGNVPVGVDGCGLPSFWGPLTGLARAYQWLDQDPRGRRALDAMSAHPGLVAGEGRFCTGFMQAGAGAVVGKVGAAGVYVALHRPTGAALAVKAVAGSMAAAESFTAAQAERMGWVPEGSLGAFTARPIKDCRGNEVGAWATEA